MNAIRAVQSKWSGEKANAEKLGDVQGFAQPSRTSPMFAQPFRAILYLHSSVYAQNLIYGTKSKYPWFTALKVAFRIMRLLNTETLAFHEFFDAEVPRYCILSHRWGENEVGYQDMLNKHVNTNGAGYKKIVGSCWTARQHNFEWIWIDTCCINKDSSAELSEAINAMFIYYSNAELCIVYMADVPTIDNTTSDMRLDFEQRWLRAKAFSQSSWFSRGWTLQELLAPANLLFYDCSFSLFGSKAELSEELSTITGIAPQYLKGTRRLNEACIAVRMAWASNRTTTRLEDEAYSLLGIFGVNMPLLYGEGKMAFFRLQREIIANSNDESIFAWLPQKVQSNDEAFGLLADSSRDFSESYNVTCDLSSPRIYPHALTNKGLELKVGFSEAPPDDDILGPDEMYVGLACKRRLKRQGHSTRLRIAVKLRRIGTVWYRINCRAFYYTWEGFHYSHFRTFYVAQPNLTTTPCLSGLKALARSKEMAREHKKNARRREQWNKFLIFGGAGAAFLGLSEDTPRQIMTLIRNA